MFINEKCKYLEPVCFVDDDKVDGYSCKKGNFDKHSCLCCEDFECKHFEKVE